MSLTPQQERFAIEVASGKTQADAYRVAYPKSLKLKDKSVHEMASKLMSNIKVLSRVKELSAKAADLAVIDRAKYITEMNRIAHSDVRKFYHEDGRIRLPTELDDESAACVKSFKIDEYGRVEYQLWDKPGTLVTVARIDGAFEKDNKQQGSAAAEFLAGLKSKVFRPIKDAADKDEY